MNETELNDLKNLYRKYQHDSENYFVYPSVKNWKPGLTQEQIKKILAYLSSVPEEKVSLHIRLLDSSEENIQNVLNEIDLVANGIGSKAKVHRIMIESPAINPLDAADILRTIDDRFEIDYQGDISVTISPLLFKAGELDQLTDEGFNDFHFDITQDIQTDQEKLEKIAAFLLTMKENGIKTSDISILIGFEGQTELGLTDLFEKILQFNPTRIRLKLMESGEKKLNLFLFAKEYFDNHGWYFIGSDLFISESDEWFEAQNNGKLSVNSLGFRVNNSRSVLGFGPGSTSFLADVYIEGIQDQVKYAESVSSGLFPVDRYFPMKLDDKIRKFTMANLICNFSVFYSEFEVSTDQKFKSYFKQELEGMPDLVNSGLIEILEDRFVITHSGELFLNEILSRFDRFKSV